MQANPAYTSMGQAFRAIIKEESTAGLYRGVAAPLTSLTILNTINFASYSKFKDVFGVDTSKLAHGSSFDTKVGGALFCVRACGSSLGYLAFGINVCTRRRRLSERLLIASVSHMRT